MIAPDDRIELRTDGETLAQCALWWSKTPRLHGKRVGYIGRYDRTDARAAQRLLRQACARLAAAGCGIAVGPVDGSTWHRYRLVTEPGTQPPFLLEPQNPAAYPKDFLAAGFTALAHYVSAEETTLERADARAARARERLCAEGVRIRKFDSLRYSEELDAIYEVATVAFASALLFSPIDRREFHALYEPLKSRVDPEFVRIAEHEGRVVGFAFGIPDGDTVVGKTQAVLPELRYAGLGAVMLDDVRRSAHARGMRRIVHALIRDDNVALNCSRRVATTMRGYTLFAGDVR